MSCCVSGELPFHGSRDSFPDVTSRLIWTHPPLFDAFKAPNVASDRVENSDVCYIVAIPTRAIDRDSHEKVSRPLLRAYTLRRLHSDTNVIDHGEVIGRNWDVFYPLLSRDANAMRKELNSESFCSLFRPS